MLMLILHSNLSYIDLAAPWLEIMCFPNLRPDCSPTPFHVGIQFNLVGKMTTTFGLIS